VWQFLETALIASVIISSLIVLWIGAQEFSKRYKKNNSDSTAECKKEISDCISCGLKNICSKK
jgi:hypothetical protein